ncbi:related to bromodomain protein BDF1 [Phialocephala subalpina]|uniref:Related to bromodomain protein BDF1 n=1 Tax=Phialocephala subalpina TaxID=576137 RepID=A0A1L7WK72_9HELO|nr:related to bromodomain protein BDF1 [Phialocephala subalpina]
MAVMTSQLSEAVALEQKTLPVPSSDKMALDLDINGTSTRDDTIHDSTSDPALSKPSPPLSNDVATEYPEVNGAGNIDAFASNQTILTNLSEPPLESLPSPTSILNSSQLPDTNTTTEPDLPASLNGEQPESSTLLVSTEDAIESAIEDVAPTSTIPPVVEAPESDLRDSTPAPAPEAALEPKVEENALATQTSELAGDSSNINSDLPLDPSPTASPEATSDQQLPQESTPTVDPLAQDEPGPSQAIDTPVESKDTDMAIMADAPQSPPPTKIAREREDDDEVEPSAKRTKTEDTDVDDMNMDDAPTLNGDASHDLTPYERKEVIKIIKLVARTKDGKNFRMPVSKLWPNFAAAYAEKISDEIDLETMEHRVLDKVYSTMGDVRDAVQLLHNNANTFNGPDHAITIAARAVRDSLLDKIAKVTPEPAPPVKKEKKPAPKRSTPIPDAAPRAAARKPSRGSHGAVAPAPQVAQTFALDPASNTPLIRRESTKLDGRPKREIHPPKSKDLPYMRPKSKKHANELKFCEDILTELNKAKYGDFAGAFKQPVDPVALNIPSYFTIIKKPMDLGTMSKKLKEGEYASAADFEKDMRQIFWNCFKFNPAGNVVNMWGKRLEELFNAQWARKDQYLADRSPPAASPVSAGESEDEEEEEEEPVVEGDTLSNYKERLLAEQQKLITLMGAKHPDQGMIQMQKDMVDIIKKHITEEETAAKNKSKKPKASKPAKKAAPAKKATAATKKSGGNRQSQKYMGTLEKETISAGLGALPDEVSNEVLADIKKERPGIDAGEDGTLELDIDVISIPLLWKIHGLIMKYAPEVQEEIKKSMAQDTPKPQPKAAPKKKNKPMSKFEQERNIHELQQTLQNYGQATSSEEPVMPTVEQHDESSGDEDSDSEEE